MVDGMTQTRFRCVVCGKISAGRLDPNQPAEGAQSTWFPRQHRGADGLPCPGNLQAAEPVVIRVRQGNRCKACGALFSMDRKRCPSCKSTDFEEVESSQPSGKAEIVSLPAAGEKPATIGQAIGGFLKSIADERSRATHKAYQQGMQVFTKVMAREGLTLSSSSTLLSVDLFSSTSQWLRDTKQHEEEGDYSIASIRLYLTAVSNFFEYLAAEEIVPVNLVKLKLLRRRRTPAQPQRLPQFPKEDIEKVIGYAQDLIYAPFVDPEDRLRNLRDRALILTLADSGLRIHEACQLTRKDIDWREMRAIIIGKGNKQAVVRFTARCLKAMKDYLDARAVLDGSSGQRLDQIPLFLRHDHPVDARRKKFQFRRMTTETGRNIVDQRVKECLGTEAVGTITPHSFRHYFVTVILNATGNLKTAQELARHSRLETTGRYAHLSNAQLDQAYYDALENKPPE